MAEHTIRRTRHAYRRGPECAVRLLISLVVLATASTMVASASETQSAAQPTYLVGRSRSAPIVDGMLDDPVWSKAREQRLDYDVDTGAQWVDSRDADASFRAVWRDGRLYVALRIEDDELRLDPRRPEFSDRLEVYERTSATQPISRYTIPVHSTGSVEDPDVPFVVWSRDGKGVEFSLDTNAMYQSLKELSLNITYVDVDARGVQSRIGWVPDSPSRRGAQLGVLSFDDGIGPRAKLGTTWGKVKALY
ncbi:hypothetical protein FJZ36_10215 [Candidatus Poribacteria bacterium]|nr:hypothetical protein [Candidatus Poribacteria bacterium]